MKLPRHPQAWPRIILALLLTMAGMNLLSQAVIYKTDGTRVVATQIDTTGGVRSFRLAGDADGITHLISREAIDSIRYPDGRVEIFTPVALPSENISLTHYKNNAGINIFPLFYGGLNVFYQRDLLHGKLGIRISGLFNLGNGVSLFRHNKSKI